MSVRKLGGSMSYEDMGPSAPKSFSHYTVGGRSVHSNDAMSGVTAGTGTKLKGTGLDRQFTIRPKQLAVPPDHPE